MLTAVGIGSPGGDTVAVMNPSVSGSVGIGEMPRQRTADGDPRQPARIAALYDSCGTLAFSLAYRIVRDRGTAEDVVQEAFLAVWRHGDRFDPERGSARAWLCQIVRNGALDRLRGRSRRQRDHQSLDDFTFLAGSVDVMAEVLQRDQRRSVLAAVAALPLGQREAIELAYFDGYSQAEIATRTGLPLGTVKSRTRAAMRALAGSLASLRNLTAAAADGSAAGPREWVGHVSRA